VPPVFSAWAPPGPLCSDTRRSPLVALRLGHIWASTTWDSRHSMLCVPIDAHGMRGVRVVKRSGQHLKSAVA